MREAVIDRDGVLHYALCADGSGARAIWLAYCDAPSWPRVEYPDEAVARGRPTCVRCLGHEALRGKDLEPIEVPCR